MNILIATKNQGKLKEFVDLFSGLPFMFHSLNEFPDLIEPQESGLTLMENALLKAKYYYDLTKMPTISDDTGLFIKALGGKPGIYTARYAHGSDQDNRHKVLSEMKDFLDRSCYFNTALVFYDGQNIITTTGFLRGEIATSEQGEQGFGYDSIFYLKDLAKTLAELDANQKNQLSHRYFAAKAMIQKLKLYYHLTSPREIIAEHFPDYVSYELLKGGMSNDTYLVKLPNRVTVFRIPGYSSEIFVDRNIEQKALLTIQNHDRFINQIRYFADGMLETSFVAQKEVDQTARFKTLQALHRLPFDTEYLPFVRFSYYERLNQLFEVELDSQFATLKAILERFKPMLEARPKVFCHNDCQLSNFIGDILIDFEFCGLNDPLFDYACFGNNDLNIGYEMAKIDPAIKNLDEALEIINLWYALQALSWYLVAIFKDKIGFSASQGLDFKAIGLMFFAKAESLLKPYQIME